MSLCCTCSAMTTGLCALLQLTNLWQWRWFHYAQTHIAYCQTGACTQEHATAQAFVHSCIRCPTAVAGQRATSNTSSAAAKPALLGAMIIQNTPFVAACAIVLRFSFCSRHHHPPRFCAGLCALHCYPRRSATLSSCAWRATMMAASSTELSRTLWHRQATLLAPGTVSEAAGLAEAQQSLHQQY